MALAAPEEEVSYRHVQDNSHSDGSFLLRIPDAAVLQQGVCNHANQDKRTENQCRGKKHRDGPHQHAAIPTEVVAYARGAD